MIATLGNVCHFLNGGTPSKEISSYFEGDIPWITSADIVGPIAGAARSFITEEAIKKSATNKVATGTVLLVTRTGVGKVAIAGRDLCFSQDITALIPDSAKLDGGYLVQYLRTKQSHFERRARGATIKGITRDVVADLSIPLPPIPDQIRIAAILDQADALRVKRKKALAQLDGLTHSIFIEMFGDPVTNPMGWQVTPLETVAEKITDGEHQTPKRTEFGIKLLSARNIRDGYLDFGDVDFIDVAEHQKISKRCNPERGDILISCSGSIGRVAIVETDEPLGLVRSAALVKPNRQKILSKYLETFLRTPHMNRMMINKAHSSSQANLFQGPIRALPIALPPIALQQEFVKKSVALQTLRNSHNAANAELDNLFASLQHRAFRGEL